MPGSNQHYNERNRDRSSPERRAGERGRDHRPDARHKEERTPHDREGKSQSYRNNHGDAYTHGDHRVYKDNRHYNQAAPSTTTSYYDDDSEPQHGEALYNLRYITTSRGICQVMEFFLDLLIVICSGVSYSNSGQYKDIASLGGLYQYYYGGANAFTGADAKRVQELDKLFYQLKLPPYVNSMACGGALMVYAGAMLALGVFRMPYRFPPLLLGEALVDALTGIGFIPAVAFYFIKLQEIYSNPICKEREELYNSKGHRGFECNLHGADIAGGLFGVLGIIIYPLSAVLAIRAFRRVWKMKRTPTEDGNL